MTEIVFFYAIMIFIAATSKSKWMRAKPMFFGSLLLISALAVLAFGLFLLWPGRWWAAECRDSCAEAGAFWIWFGSTPTFMILIISLRLLRYKDWRYFASASALFSSIPLICFSYLIIRDREHELDKSEASWMPYCAMLESNHPYFALYLQKRAREYPQEFQSIGLNCTPLFRPKLEQNKVQ